ncbi:MAG: Hsp20/alpha crystallin family protein [Acidobacteria bacterium]|nr:Hsp20/alpha crystallin family protein [Acidobacteriota bacterium]
MPTREVQTIRAKQLEHKSFSSDVEKLVESIRNRAHELFEGRGLLDGGELDDWFQAERELFFRPPSELTETEKEFHLKLAVPGCEARQMTVAVEPGRLTIRGEATRKEEKKEEKTIFSEFSEKKLFRRFDLAKPVNPDLVKATLEDGMLMVTLPKTAATVRTPGEKPMAAAA